MTIWQMLALPQPAVCSGARDAHPADVADLQQLLQQAAKRGPRLLAAQHLDHNTMSLTALTSRGACALRAICPAVRQA